MPRIQRIVVDPNTVAIDLIHVIFPDDYYCTPDRILDAAHDALVDAAVADHEKQHGELSDGEFIVATLRTANPRPTNLEDAMDMLTDLGLMTFARQ